MTEWRDVGLIFAGHWLFAAAVAPLIWAVVAAYRQTRPVASRSTRYALSALRWLSLSLLLGLIAEPIVAALTRRAERPSLALLLDTSASMGMVEDGRTRHERVAALIGDGEFASLLDRWQVTVCGFSEKPYPMDTDDLGERAIGGHATDLGRALDECGGRRPSAAAGRGAVLVLSDGAHNLGIAPATAAGELRKPVHSLVVGSATDPADLQVAAAVSPSTYAGQALSLDVTVRSWGFEGRTAEVEVWEGDLQLARQVVSLAGDGVDQQAGFELPPAEPGPHLLSVRVPVLEGEQATDNNQTLVFARVHRDRARVLLAASAPSSELAFTWRALSADSSLSVDLVSGGRRPVAIDATVLSDYRAVVLVDPGPDILAGRAGEALARFAGDGGGVLLIAGPKSLRSWPAESPLAHALPLVLEAGDLIPAAGPLRAHSAALEHPVLSHPEAAGGEAVWERLPPVAALPPGALLRDGAQALLLSQSGQPVVAVSRFRRGRAAVAAAAGFWRLDLMSSGADEDPRVIRRLWQSTVAWLTMEATEGQVRATAERPVFRAGAPATIVAEVYDELMRPQPAAHVEAALEGRPISAASESLALESPTLESLVLESQGGGRYRASWLGLSPGEYTFAVRARVAGSPVGAAAGRFIVEEHSLESMDVRARPGVLAEMARASGGRSYALEDWRQLKPALEVAPRLVDEEWRWSPWGKTWVLLLLVGLLSTEWVVRKRQGML